VRTSKGWKFNISCSILFKSLVSLTARILAVALYFCLSPLCFQPSFCCCFVFAFLFPAILKSHSGIKTLYFLLEQYYYIWIKWFIDYFWKQIELLSLSMKNNLLWSFIYAAFHSRSAVCARIELPVLSNPYRLYRFPLVHCCISFSQTYGFALTSQSHRMVEVGRDLWRKPSGLTPW